jgi:hypothetical protein
VRLNTYDVREYTVSFAVLYERVWRIGLHYCRACMSAVVVYRLSGTFLTRVLLHGVSTPSLFDL